MKYLYYLLFTLLFATTSSYSQKWESFNKNLIGVNSSMMKFKGSNGLVINGVNGLIQTTDYGNNWSTVKSDLSNLHVTDIAFDGSLVYASTYFNGVFVSSDNGQSWQQLNDSIKTRQVWCMATNNSKVYAGVYGGMWIVTKDSATFRKLDSNNLSTYITSIAIDNNIIYIGTNNGIVYKTSDEGISWKQVNTAFDNSSNPIKKIIIQKNTIFVAYSHILYKDSNNSGSWTNSFSFTNFAGLESNGSTIYIADTDDGIYKSSDNGKNWDILNPGKLNGSISCITTNGTSLFRGLRGGDIETTVDDGQNWSILSNNLNYTNIDFIDILGSEIYTSFGTFGLFKSNITNINWEFENTIFSKSHVSKLIQNGKNIIAGTNSGAIDGTILDNRGIYLSTDEGKNWKPWDENMGFKSVKNIINIDDKVIIANGGGIYIRHFSDSLWSRIHIGTDYDPVSSLIQVGNNFIAAVSNTSFVPNPGGVFMSNDFGLHWNRMDTIFNENILNCMGSIGDNIYLSVSKSFKLVSPYFFGRTAGIYKSTNLGKDWKLLTNGIDSTIYVSAFAVRGNDIFAATSSNGIYANYNESDHWENISNDLIPQNILTIKNIDNYLYAGTQGYGMWRLDISGLSVKEDEFSNNDLKIYPNPAKEMINLSVDNFGNTNLIQVDIFDLAGIKQYERVYSDIANNVINIETEGLINGIYYCQITCGRKKITQQFVLSR